MNRRKKIGETSNIKLFIEDEQELKRKVKSGTFASYSAAVRQSVSMQLTAERLEKYGDDAQYKEFKKRQLEVLEPLNRGMTEVNNELQEIKDELSENRKVIRELNIGLKSRNEGTEAKETADLNGNKMDKVENFFKRIMEQLNYQRGQTEYQTKLAQQSREDSFVMRSMLLFFTLGYQAGKIRPSKVLGEPAFLKLIEDATGEIIKEARVDMIADGNNLNSDIYIKQFVQTLLNKMYQPES